MKKEEEEDDMKRRRNENHVNERKISVVKSQ